MLLSIPADYQICSKKQGVTLHRAHALFYCYPVITIDEAVHHFV